MIVTFEINQKIKNNGNNSHDFYPYAQIVRNKKPEVLGFYILHEGFIGVFDDQLKEEDYKDIEEKKFTTNSSSGWLGITDKYWITAIVPEENSTFKSEFVYDKNYRANFIQTEPIQGSQNQVISNKIRIFTAAKEVAVIDTYAEKQKIDKFDLTIDWGFLYFLTRPLFTALEYFFKIFGNLAKGTNSLSCLESLPIRAICTGSNLACLSRLLFSSTIRCNFLFENVKENILAACAPS